jgi:hypothetical protein
MPLLELLVRSGLATAEELSSGNAPARPVSPRQIAMDLGLKDPAKIEAFETVVRALLVGETQQVGRRRSA